MNKNLIQTISILAIFGCLTISLSSCWKKNKNSPGLEYMPDMYRSPSLESNMAYVSMTTGDSMQANKLPVAGTIARGFMPYPYSNDTTGYGEAGRKLRNPLPLTDVNINKGEILFGKYCVHCHGTTGQGDGPVALKLPGAPPSYTSPVLMALPEGKMFHTITYGKNLMGSHAGQLSVNERWLIIMYIHKLQNKTAAQVAAEVTPVLNKNKK